MHTKLEVIRQGLLLAKRFHSKLKASAPAGIRSVPEIEELETGLDWCMKRVESLRMLAKDLDKNIK